MPDLALLVAMRSEVPLVLRHAAGVCRVGDNAVRLVVTGIGPKKARRATRQVCSGSLGCMPDLLINAGFCGAVRNELDVGHLIIANLIAYRDRVIRPANPLVDKIAGRLAEYNCRIGKLQTFNRPVLSRAGVSANTLAVDMESFAIAQTAAAHHIPAIFIKAVSDRVPRHAGLLSLLTLVRSLKINTRRARARLNEIVNKILADPNLLDDSRVRPNPSEPELKIE
jgi:nucleoside phosphorylase